MLSMTTTTIIARRNTVGSVDIKHPATFRVYPISWDKARELRDQLNTLLDEHDKEK